MTILVIGSAFDLAHAAQFGDGNVVVYRVGTSSGSLINTGNAVFLDEYTPTGCLVQSIALPTTVTGSIVDAPGVIDTTRTLTDFASGNNPRSAVSADSVAWVAGGAGGVR